MRTKTNFFAFVKLAAGVAALSVSAHAFASTAVETDDFKKIVTTKTHDAAKSDELPQMDAGSSGEHGPASEAPEPKGVVTTEPAPGTRHTASDAAAPVESEKPAPKAAAKKAAAKADEKAAPKSEDKSEKKKEAKADKAEKTEKAEAAASPNAPVDSETSLRWLTNGNTRFVKKQFRADGRTSIDRQRLLNGEHPHAIILASSDSRVPSELIFDQALGEVYVVRTAGEALDSAVIASIEDVILQSSPRLIVVLGHTNSHMVELALKDGEAPSESIGKALADIRPRLKSLPAGKQSPNLEIEATVNADGAARDLVKRSDIIRKKVESGDLVIKPALYRMDSGKVTFY